MKNTPSGYKSNGRRHRIEVNNPRRTSCARYVEITFDTGDDKTIDGDLHVPVNKKVRLYLRAKDVIHSFFVPVLRLKQDAVPGREIIAWFEAIKAGRWEIPCAELCGPGHSGMKGWLKVDTDEEYAEWVQEQWPSS